VKRKRRTPSRDRPKVPPSSGSDIHEPARFMEFIAALEVCRGLVCSGSAVPIRLALIILDNVAEVLMLHKCSAILERDGFMSRIIPLSLCPASVANVRSITGGANSSIAKLTTVDTRIAKHTRETVVAYQTEVAVRIVNTVK
jgi:hypothetical protein